MNTSSRIKQRLESVIVNNQSNDADNLLKVLESDLRELLGSYMVIEEGSLELNLSVSEDRKVYFNCEVAISHLLNVGKMID